jgi:hypothetical protein
MKKIIGIGIVALIVIVGTFIIIRELGKNKPVQETVIHSVIERQLPVFRMASYQINYSGKIYKNGTDTFLKIPTGSYTVRFDYEAVVLIGTRIHPKVTLIDDVINLDFSEVKLEVISVTPTSLELVRANTTGWRWFVGSGIPIQDGLFEPFMNAINTLPEMLNEDEEIQEKAMNSLIEHYKSFYSMLNYAIEITN